MSMSVYICLYACMLHMCILIIAYTLHRRRRSGDDVINNDVAASKFGEGNEFKLLLLG